MSSSEGNCVDTRIRIASLASYGMRIRPASGSIDQPGRCSDVPLEQTVDYKHPLMKRLETQSHFVRGLLVVTNTPVGTLEPQVKRALADADPNLTVTSVRTMQQQVDRSFDQQRAVASLAGLFGVVHLAPSLSGQNTLAPSRPSRLPRRRVHVSPIAMSVVLSHVFTHVDELCRRGERAARGLDDGGDPQQEMLAFFRNVVMSEVVM